VSLYRVRALDRAVDAAAFHCGKPPLDDYVQKYASQDVRRNVARVFVATPEEHPRRLAGYFTLSAGSVACSDLPDALARKLPRYPVPVALIGRLAVDTSVQGQGVGSILLADACRKVAEAGIILGVAGVIVDAKDTAAAAFYRHFGFAPLPGRADRLMLPAHAFAARS
jgi:ribosomal protein S18 acetylase RimI-like enzyme